MYVKIFQKIPLIGFLAILSIIFLAPNSFGQSFSRTKANQECSYLASNPIIQALNFDKAVVLDPNGFVLIPTTTIFNLFVGGNRLLFNGQNLYVDVTNLPASVFTFPYSRAEVVGKGTSWYSQPMGPYAVKLDSSNLRSIDSRLLNPQNNILCSDYDVIFGKLFTLTKEYGWVVIYFLWVGMWGG